MVPWYEIEINDAGTRAVPPLDLVTAIDWLGDNTVRVHVTVANGVAANTPPSTPSTPSTATTRFASGVNAISESQTSDPEGNWLFYKWDWGDGEISDWIGPVDDATPVQNSHAWAVEGNYEVRVKARDPYGEESDWSTALAITVDCCNGRVGDANGQGGDEPTIGDVSVMIDAKYITGDCVGSDPENPIIVCLKEADVNQSAVSAPTCDDISIGDISILIDYLFITGPSLGLPDCP